MVEPTQARREDKSPRHHRDTRHVAALAFASLLLGACAYGATPNGEPTTELQNAAANADEDVVHTAMPPVDNAMYELDEQVAISYSPTMLSEQSACEMVLETYWHHGLELGCPTTIKVCPDLLRDAFGVACLLYYTDSITSCADNIQSASTCDELYDTSCAIAPVVPSAPRGCDEN